MFYITTTTELISEDICHFWKLIDFDRFKEPNKVCKMATTSQFICQINIYNVVVKTS